MSMAPPAAGAGRTRVSTLHEHSPPALEWIGGRSARTAAAVALTTSTTPESLGHNPNDQGRNLDLSPWALRPCVDFYRTTFLPELPARLFNAVG